VGLPHELPPCLPGWRQWRHLLRLAVLPAHDAGSWPRLVAPFFSTPTMPTVPTPLPIRSWHYLPLYTVATSTHALLFFCPRREWHQAFLTFEGVEY